MNKKFFPSLSFTNNKNIEHSPNLIPSDLVFTNEILYKPCGFICSQIDFEPESNNYGACDFKLNNKFIKFRVAKSTPTKVGQFVTLWKRGEDNSTRPYDQTDITNFFVISTRKEDYFGQFIFPKFLLCKYDIISTNGEGGKRGIRVYPSWEKKLNKQAQKTQDWQTKYFLDLSQVNSIDYERAKMLYQCLSRG